MTMSSRRADSGLAALEFLLVYLLVLSLLALSVPLVIALQERVRLERAAGHTARFATAAPDRARYGSVKRRPTIEEVQAEALRAYSLIGTADPGATFSVSVSDDPRTALPGAQITITITRTVSLGTVGVLMRLIGVSQSENIDMTVTALGRQE